MSLASNCSQEFTKDLLDNFLKSRASGTNLNTIELYHFALDRFIGYPLTPEGIKSYLDSLTCSNGKHNYYRGRNTALSDGIMKLVDWRWLSNGFRN